MLKTVNQSQGFTLVELMVVLFLAAIAAVISSGYIGNWYKHYEFSGFLRSMHSSITLARARAIAVQKPVALSFEESSESFGGMDTRTVDKKWNDTSTKDYYQVAFQWSKKTTTDGQDFYSITPDTPDPVDPTVVRIWFDRRGLAVVSNVDRSPKQYEFTIKGNALKKTVALGVTEMGRIIHPAD